MKVKSVYLCNNCGFASAKWIGKCPECESWNSFIEDSRENKSFSAKRVAKGRPRESSAFSEVIKNLENDTRRIVTGIAEFDQVAGGGIMPGSLTLLGGEPGIGKSTLTLQICERVSALGKKVLYISGEESESQIASRGNRLELKLENFKLLNEVNIETILATIDAEKPELVVIDSIQVVFSEAVSSAAGTVTQVRLCTEALMEYAKPKGLPMLIVGHVTKDGGLAGPRVLEHLVDAVYLLEGDRFGEFRLLRGVKNRFGSTNEVGVFEMAEEGLREVKNPSEKFLSERGKNVPGVALVCTLEGTRPFIVEVQALTSPTAFGYPRRHASGFDLNRLNLLIAVLERHMKANLNNQDVYVNVVGGLRLQDPACDLGICMAILSSLKKTPLPKNAVYIGEVGLTGEVRKGTRIERRKKEIEKLGFEMATQW